MHQCPTKVVVQTYFHNTAHFIDVLKQQPFQHLFSALFSLSPTSPDRTCFPDNNNGITAVALKTVAVSQRHICHLPSVHAVQFFLLSNQQLPPLLLLLLYNVSLLFPLPSNAADDVRKEKEIRKMMAITI